MTMLKGSDLWRALLVLSAVVLLGCERDDPHMEPDQPAAVEEPVPASDPATAESAPERSLNLGLPQGEGAGDDADVTWPEEQERLPDFFKEGEDEGRVNVKGKVYLKEEQEADYRNYQENIEGGEVSIEVKTD